MTRTISTRTCPLVSMLLGGGLTMKPQLQWMLVRNRHQVSSSKPNYSLKEGGRERLLCYTVVYVVVRTYEYTYVPSTESEDCLSPPEGKSNFPTTFLFLTKLTWRQSYWLPAPDYIVAEQCSNFNYYFIVTVHSVNTMSSTWAVYFTCTGSIPVKNLFKIWQRQLMTMNII